MQANGDDNDDYDNDDDDVDVDDDDNMTMIYGKHDQRIDNHNDYYNPVRN